MRLLPSSPRLRRRLSWLGVMALIAGGVATLVVLMPGPHKEAEAPVTGKGWTPPPDEHQVKRTANSTGGALAVAAAFVNTAVARHHVASSWNLVTPDFRSGYTKASWAKGKIPVVPFPVDGVKW